MEDKSSFDELINITKSVKFDMYVGDDRINVSEDEAAINALFTGFKNKGFNVSVDAESNCVVVSR